MKRLAAVFLSIFILLNQAAAASDFRFSPRPNKASLIHWRNWSLAAFSEAKSVHKPVLLSLSAIWCHWCHVMDETTYSDAAVIAYINEHFIPVRVDSDMHPDIDSLYNQGGWPSTLVLTSSGDVIRGATYIPTEEMVSWLKKGLAESGSHRDGEAGRKEGSTGHLREEATGAADVREAFESLRSAFDERHGGFGLVQKFPNPAAIDFLLTEFSRRGDEETKRMISLTLDSMEKGEINDIIEGGFFRYATRSDWSAPHYEKILDLNAGLAENYASASLALGEETYKKVLEKTIHYLMKNLYDRKTGAFFGSQDADEKYYASKKRRGRRPRIDTTIYAGPNAEMITALVAASGATGSKKYLELARRTAGFMLGSLYSKKEGTFRYYRDSNRHLAGLLDDNALFGNALIDLYNATGEMRYIDAAQDLASILAGKFFSAKEGRFRATAEAAFAVPSEPGALTEYETAVSNLRAAVFLLRIASYREETKLRGLANRAIARTRGDCERIGPIAGFCGMAFEWQLREPLEIVIVTAGGPDRFLSAVNRIYVPWKVVKVLSPKTDESAVRSLGYPLRESLYLCSGKRCFAALRDPGKVVNEIRKYKEALKEER
jgi:uncharacterized protein YyaL (SSP411 family)